MDRTTRVLTASLLALASLAAAPSASCQDSGIFLDGRWDGSVDLGEGPEELSLRLFSGEGRGDGGIVDMPEHGLFGYPMGELSRGPEGLSFTLFGSASGNAPFAGRFELSGAPKLPSSDGSFAIGGAFRLIPGADRLSSAAAEGSFSLSFSGSSSRGSAFGEDYAFGGSRGLLRGSLLLPEDWDAEMALPLVLILSGAEADRDGNNYAVPGRSDALADLAIALARRGIASLRYDQRGAGESYRLAGKEEDRRFDDHIEDARAALLALAADSRFSSITVVGFAQGALVGASVLKDASALQDAALKGRVAGFVALCASGRTELEIIEDELSYTPDELMPEARSIMDAIAKGRIYPNPSSYFADYFRPSYQAYLSSLFSRDIRASVASLGCPVLVAAGGSDLQVSLGEAELLAEAKEGAAFRVIAGMSHALKETGDDEEANYASFTDPTLPFAEGLADAIAAFAMGDALPGEDPRFAAMPETVNVEPEPDAAELDSGSYPADAGGETGADSGADGGAESPADDSPESLPR
jgi:pimeloyl-ACP methyl ester carboxylesterase